jgi:hypothetical protein
MDCVWHDPNRIAVAAQAAPPLVDALDHLQNAQVILERPNPKNPGRRENALAGQLTRALANIEESKENKGSNRPLAIKAVKNAQAELAAGDDEAHRAKALEYVKEAIEHMTKARDLRR